MKKNSFFWVSYSDLMTSLFFIMLVLYVVTFVLLKKEKDGLLAKARQLEEIEAVEKALETLDTNYFQFDNSNKRYRLAIDARFTPNSASILDIPKEKRVEFLSAGKELYSKLDTIIQENPDINYLLVIEGNTQRFMNNWQVDPNMGYRLSYKRALALYNYWLSNGIDFRNLGSQCEIVIAGSGYFGQSRDIENPNNNRKFSIQITSKVGQFLELGR
ncbi:MAG: hypothetical protein HWE24_16720 [Oceanospirillaceae bacterium]|nr:hypothetical protein [Oceanospirillaceae bacterium]